LVRCAVAAHIKGQRAARSSGGIDMSFHCGPLIHDPVGFVIGLSNLKQTVVPRPARPSVSDGIKDTL
jgi:hypothetical protein